MKIIGCDYHPRYQQIAMMDTETGELVERRLEHENGEARAFYASLAKPVRVGMEATGYGQWFERMLAEQGHELWIGHASEIRAGVVRKQKTDARDAGHLLRLLAENRFPRIWIPSPAERDTRQLLRHRYKLVCFRVSVKNQLHGLAMSQGVCRKKKLFTAKGRNGSVRFVQFSQDSQMSSRSTETCRRSRIRRKRRSGVTGGGWPSWSDSPYRELAACFAIQSIPSRSSSSGPVRPGWCLTLSGASFSIRHFAED